MHNKLCVSYIIISNILNPSISVFDYLPWRYDLQQQFIHNGMDIETYAYKFKTF